MDVNTIICGKSEKVMKDFSTNSFDAIVTDIPYGIGFMGKDWDTFNNKYISKKKCIQVQRRINKPRTDGRKVPHDQGAPYAAQYDYSRNAEYQEWCRIWSREALRVAKPGAFLLCFGGTRTYHRVTCGLEDAGWQIRDCMMYLYGSGFPKSLNISKAIDKAKGAKRETQKLQKGDMYGNYEELNIDTRLNEPSGIVNIGQGERTPVERHITTSATDLAKLWDGYGTALKPAWEPIIVVMKPLDGTFAANAEKWGVAGLNIDGGRIRLDGEKCPSGSGKRDSWRKMEGRTDIPIAAPNSTPPQGRWPANLILDEEAAAMLDEQSGILQSNSGNLKFTNMNNPHGIYGKYNPTPTKGITDSGGASRFFYCAKASRAERNAGLNCDPQITDDGRKKKIDNAYLRGKTLRQNNHPTVKPLALMEYLCKLLKPPTEHPVLLDPFCGSGTTLMAAVNTGWDYVGIEKEKEYCEIAEKRVAFVKEQAAGQMALFSKDAQ